MERDASSPESGQARLINLLRRLEKEMDDAVADMVDSPGDPQLTEQPADMISSGETTPAESSGGQSSKDPVACSLKSKSKSEPGDKNVPMLKPSQKHIVKTLNSQLTQMKKYTAYIHPIRNSHASIISRDVANFDFHRLGEGVLRHWADEFAF